MKYMKIKYYKYTDNNCNRCFMYRFKVGVPRQTLADVKDLQRPNSKWRKGSRTIREIEEKRFRWSGYDDEKLVELTEEEAFTEML